VTWSDQKIEGICDLVFGDRGYTIRERAKRLIRFWGRGSCRGQHAACPGCKTNLCLRGCGRNLGPYEECNCGMEAAK